MSKQQISWWLWAVGTVLIVLSWFEVVDTTIGWCGFAIGMVGSVLGWGLRPPQSGRADDGRDVDRRHDRQ